MAPPAAPQVRKLLINGRFLAQPLSGVQRFATEITSALRRLAPDRVEVLGPSGASDATGPVRIVGRRGGHLWEQLELPSHATAGTLINLGNTAPLRLAQQIVVVHDAGVFSTPRAYSMRFRLWYKFVQRRLAHGGACVVTVSEFARQDIARCLGIPREKIAVISEGADHLDAIPADDRVLSRLPPGRFVLVVGNLAEHKNLVALGTLAQQLAARGEILVVTGALAMGAFRPVGPGGLPQPACYVGRVTDAELKSLYLHAACLVFASRYEGFGLPAVEAMACGCPVVASRIPALQEVCAEAAVYVDPHHPGDIAAGVLGLLDAPALHTAMSSAARARATHFTWHRAATQLAAIADRVERTPPGTAT